MAQTTPPLVPEGIHTQGKAQPELCGLSAANAVELERMVTNDPDFLEENSTDLYRVFNRERDFVQFVFPRPTTLRFPMITCRRVLPNPDGTSTIQRQMHCEGTREECDRIFIEFNELDQRVQQALGATERG